MLPWGATACLAALVPAPLGEDVWRQLRNVVAIAIVLILLLLAASTLRHTPRRMQATAAAAAFGLVAMTLAGHAAMHEGALGSLHRINDAVHLLAGGAWLGSLMPLTLVLRARPEPAMRESADVALRRFSAAGHGAVVLVLASGVANTALVLGRWPTDWSSPYQALLATKIGVVALMIALALTNRYVLVPRGAPGAVRMLTGVEIGLALMVVGLVSVFGTLDPG